jgi:hypothetical protein
LRIYFSTALQTIDFSFGFFLSLLVALYGFGSSDGIFTFFSNSGLSGFSYLKLSSIVLLLGVVTVFLVSYRMTKKATCKRTNSCAFCAVATLMSDNCSRYSSKCCAVLGLWAASQPENEMREMIPPKRILSSLIFIGSI